MKEGTEYMKEGRKECCLNPLETGTALQRHPPHPHAPLDFNKERTQHFEMQMALKMFQKLRGGGGNLKISPPLNSLFSWSPPSRLLSGASADLVGDDLLSQHLPHPPVNPLIPTILQPRVVVYDGVCHLCHRGVKWVIAADKHRKIKFCCLQSKAAEPYLRACGLDREDVLRRFLFIEGSGLYHQASTAALRVLSYLPLPYSALSVLLIVPTPLRDAIYDYVAKRRYDWFGKEVDCLVLKEKEMLERFIDREEFLDQRRSDL